MTFIEPNYTLLSFQYPAIFERDIADEIVSIFKKAFENKKYFLSIDFIISQFVNKSKRKLIKSKDKGYLKFLRDYSGTTSSDENPINDILTKQNQDIIKENIRIMVLLGYLNYTYTFEYYKNELKEIRTVYIVQKTTDISFHALIHSKNQVMNYILSKLRKVDVPFKFNSMVSRDELLKKIKEGKAELNKIIYIMVKEDELIDIDLIVPKTKSEYINKTFYFPGKKFFKETRNLLDKNLIPSLSMFFKIKGFELKKNLATKKIHISIDDILSGDYSQIYYLCSLFIEEYKAGSKIISHNEYNLSFIILSLWLHLQDDPAVTIAKYPEIDFNQEVLAPIFIKYISKFEQIQEFLKKIKGFLHYLPQVIKEDELISFFKAKKIDPKYIRAFLVHLPDAIKATKINKDTYYIDKGQIIPALIYLFDNRYFKTTELGCEQFSVLVKAFREVEVKAVSYSQIIIDFVTVSSEYDYVLNNILKGHEEYEKLIKRKDKLKDKKRFSKKSDKPSISEKSEFSTEVKEALTLIKDKLGENKKIISEEDLSVFSAKERQKIFDALHLYEINCVDNKENDYIFYISRSLLSFDDARFFRSKPTYELLLKRFNLD